MQIDHYSIGLNSRPFIIAEMSGNHNQSLERALEIVDAAAASGVDALKIQTYTADTMTIDCDAAEFRINDAKSLWNGKNLYQLYQEAHTPWEWHKPIFDRCREKGIIGFSTPFDETAVDFLEELQVPCYKIASFENTDIPLLRRVARTGKPVIISSGMASISELDEAVKTLRLSGAGDICLLKCTSNYPASPKDSNLATIPHMRELFNCEVGLSDHTLGIGAAIAGVALGASVIEKHFTLSRAEGGVDAAFSFEPHEMKALVEETQRAWEALGRISYGPSEEEKRSLVFRRSIYVVRDMEAGKVIGPDDVRIIRPGYGLSPKHWDAVIGKRLACSVRRGTPFSWELLY